MTVKQSALTQFRQELERYGLADNLQDLLEVVRASYLTNGSQVPELQEPQRQMLEQLGIGWRNLSPKGKAIAAELIDATIEASDEAVRHIVSEYPARVVALFLEAASRGSDIYSLVFQEEAADFDRLSDASSIAGIVPHIKVHPLILALGEELVQQQLAIKYSALAYRGAKYDRVFIYFPAVVAQKIGSFVGKSVGLDKVQEELDRYSMLRQSPLPSLREFETKRLSRDDLQGYVGEALSQQLS